MARPVQNRTPRNMSNKEITFTYRREERSPNYINHRQQEQHANRTQQPNTAQFTSNIPRHSDILHEDINIKRPHTGNPNTGGIFFPGVTEAGHQHHGSGTHHADHKEGGDSFSIQRGINTKWTPDKTGDNMDGIQEEPDMKKGEGTTETQK